MKAVEAAALSRCDRLYLTRVDCKVEGDARFPEFDIAEWKLTHEEHHGQDEKHPHSFTLQTLDRVS